MNRQFLNLKEMKLSPNVVVVIIIKQTIREIIKYVRK